MGKLDPRHWQTTGRNAHRFLSLPVSGELILSPYFQQKHFPDTDGRKRVRLAFADAGRDIQIILVFMAKKAIISGFFNQTNGDSFVFTPYVNYYDDSTDLSVEVLSGIGIPLSSAHTPETLIAAVNSLALSYGNGQGYGLTAADIYWAAGTPVNNSRSFTNPSRTLNSAFQISTTRDASVEYSVDIATSVSLSGGAVGTVFLEYADDSGFTTNVKECQRYVNGNTGTLVIGLTLNQTATAALSGNIPAGKYARIRTANTTGTPTFTFRSAQEVLL